MDNNQKETKYNRELNKIKKQIKRSILEDDIHKEIGFTYIRIL